MKEINTPEKLLQEIGNFLQSKYTQDDLLKMYADTLKCAASFRGIYSNLPIIVTKEKPLDGLQHIMDWSKDACKVIDNMISDFDQQTICDVICQFKKLRCFADKVLSLVDKKLQNEIKEECVKKKAQEQADIQAEIDRRFLAMQKTNSAINSFKLDVSNSHLVLKTKIKADISCERGFVSLEESKESKAVQSYLTKDPTFNSKLFQLGNRIDDIIKKINTLIGNDTSIGELLDIYCKLKAIPIEQLFKEITDACSFNDLFDIIFGNCDRLYMSIENVITIFKKMKIRKKGCGDLMISSKDNWDAIKKEYDISKKDFGKKINFVLDSFKRKIIFRDVEHAFVLASQGFSKPALILAGGVIEELLKEYLRHQKITFKGNNFVDYIFACENNKLLQSGVLSISDSIRDFRNLVHISKEDSKRNTITIPTAKSAVASIFTIANNFSTKKPA